MSSKNVTPKGAEFSTVALWPPGPLPPSEGQEGQECQSATLGKVTPLALPDLMHQLTIRGLTLSVVGCNAIEVLGPLDRLTPDLRQALAAHKPVLLQILGQHVRPATCPHCGSTDLASGVEWLWCLTCEAKLGPAEPVDYEKEERGGIQQEQWLPDQDFDPKAIETLREHVAWFERRDQWYGRAPVVECESPPVVQTDGDSDPSPLSEKEVS